MNFFIATMGRSGSVWLSKVLNKSETHTVLHEEADPRQPSHVMSYTPFPLERFDQPNYGEVHGMLRYSLSADVVGLEYLIQKRGLLLRDIRPTIASWMNRENRNLDELSAVIFEVMTQRRLLEMWAESDKEVRTFRLEEVGSNIGALRDLCNWLEIGYSPVREDLTPVNANPRPENVKFEWNDEAESLLQRIAKRQHYEGVITL